MANTLTSTDRKAAGSRSETHEPLDRERLENWFVQQGVPRFVERYAPVEGLPLATGVLVIVLAFEVTARLGSEFPSRPALTTPAIVFLCVLPAMPLLRWLLRVPGPDGSGRASKLAVLGCVPALALEVFLFTEAGTLPAIYEHPWFEFGIAVSTLLTAMILADGQSWAAASGRARVLGATLLSGMVVANLSFAIDRPTLQWFHWYVVSPYRGDWFHGTYSASLPALIVSAVIVTLALALRHASRGVDDVAVVGRRAQFRAAAPLLALLFGLQTAILPFVPPTSRYDAVAVVLGVIAGFTATSLSASVARRVSSLRGRRAAIWARLLDAARTYGLLAAVAVLFLLGYPLVVSVDEGMSTGLTALAVNVGYFALAIGIVAFGVDRVTAWGFREGLRSFLPAVVALIQGIPLLLVFAAFFSITADMWQFAHRIDSTDLGLLCAGVLVLAFVFLFLRALAETPTQCHFDSWIELEHAASQGHTAVDDTSGISGTLKLARPDDAELSEPIDFSPSLLQRLNAATVMVVYEAFVLIPVGIASIGVYLLLGHLAVDKTLLKDWQVKPENGESFTDPGVFHPLWLNVALFLAAFSVLYLAVAVMTVKDQRDIFMAVPQRAMRQRYAARYAYERAYCTTGLRN